MNILKNSRDDFRIVRKIGKCGDFPYSRDDFHIVRICRTYGDVPYGIGGLNENDWQY